MARLDRAELDGAEIAQRRVPSPGIVPNEAIVVGKWCSLAAGIVEPDDKNPSSCFSVRRITDDTPAPSPASGRSARADELLRRVAVGYSALKLRWISR